MEKELVSKLNNVEGYVSLKRLVIECEKEIDKLFNSLSDKDKQNVYPKTDNLKKTDKEMERLWGFINNLSQRQGEELDYMSDLFSKVCALVNKNLNL